jgi:hypothetical protein
MMPAGAGPGGPRGFGWTRRPLVPRAGEPTEEVAGPAAIAFEPEPFEELVHEAARPERADERLRLAAELADALAGLADAREKLTDTRQKLADARERLERQAAELAAERERAARQASHHTAEIVFERERAARRLVQSTQAQRKAMALVAIVAVILAIVSFAARQVAVSRERDARDLAAVREADLGLRQSSSRVGAILAMDAYEQARGSTTKRAMRSALLSALLNVDEFAHAQAPPWSLGAFAERGRLFVTAGPARDERRGGELTIIRPAESRSASQNVPFRPAFLCGFRSAPEIAVADGSTIAAYSYLFGPGSRVSVTSRTWRSDEPLAAIACLPQANIVAIADRKGDVSILDMASGTRALVAASRGDVAGIVPSNTGRFVAVIGPAMEWFTVYSAAPGGASLGTRRPRHPGCYRCTGELAFDASDMRVAWIDGRKLHIAPIAALQAGSEVFACDLCTADALIVWTADKAVPDVLVSGRRLEFDPAARRYRSYPAYEVARRTAPPPVYDADSAPLDPHVATAESDGVAFRSLADGGPPMVGLDATCPGRGAYGLTRTSLILSGRTLVAAAFGGSGRRRSVTCGASDPLLGDPGDGEHLIALDPSNDVVSVLDVDDTGAGASRVRVASSFELPKEQRGDRRDAYSVAYDPRRRIVAVASGWGVEQFTPVGGRLGSLTRDQLEKLAGTGRSECPLRLSPRGSYVRVPAANGACGPGAEEVRRPSPETLVTVSGRRIRGGTFASLWGISRDDRFAFGTAGAPGYVAYRLPGMETVSLGDAVVRDGTIDAAPDGRTFAYETADGRIALFDGELHAQIGSALPLPPHFDGFRRLAFSPDGRYLVGAYHGTDGKALLATYDLDPSYWRAQLCADVRNLSPAEKREIGAVALQNELDPNEEMEIAAGQSLYKGVCPVL